MKKSTCIASFICFILVFSSCGSDINKAKSLIKKELTENWADGTNYQPLEYGSLDSAYTSYTEDPKIKSLLEDIEKKAEILEEKKDEIKDICQRMNIKVKMGTVTRAHLTNYQESVKKAKHLNKEIILEKAMVDSLRQSYIPTFSGYSLIHRFKEKDLLHMDVELSMKFYFDKNFTKVISMNEISATYASLK